MGRMRTRALTVAIALVWAAFVIGPPVALVAWRDQRLTMVDTPRARADWESFRNDMRSQSGREGPVQRKVPRSAEPPELVWLRDYIHLAVIAWIGLVGVLGAFLAALALGVARGGGSAAENRPSRGRDDEEQNQHDAQDARERRHG